MLFCTPCIWMVSCDSWCRGEENLSSTHGIKSIQLSWFWILFMKNFLLRLAISVGLFSSLLCFLPPPSTPSLSLFSFVSVPPFIVSYFHDMPVTIYFGSHLHGILYYVPTEKNRVTRCEKRNMYKSSNTKRAGTQCNAELVGSEIIFMKRRGRMTNSSVN